MSKSVLKGRYDGGEEKGSKRALLVIDVQNEYFTGKLPISYPTNSFSNILQVMDKANENEIPVVVIQHTLNKEGAVAFVKDTDGWELHDEIKNRKYSHYIEKTLPSSFIHTDLEEWLAKNNIDTITISGYMTHQCCDITAKYAMHLGYNVEFLSDATGTISIENEQGKISAEELHKMILVIQASRFSKVLNTNEWINQIKKDK